MNNIFFTLLKSIILTLTISGIVGFFLLIFNIPFIQSFLFFTAVQFIFFYFYGNSVKNKTNKLILETELKAIEERSKQTTTVLCPCDRNIQTTIPLSINGDNSYMCPGCDKKISVFIETKTALSTTPVSTEIIEAPLFVDAVKKMIEKQNK